MRSQSRKSRFGQLLGRSRRRHGRIELDRVPRLECLESRIVMSTLPPPNPIDPRRGEANLLEVVQMHADKQNLNAQDHFPVPYTIIVSAGGADPTVVNWKAGSPVRLDADQSRSTGKGGKDVQVELNTVLYTNEFGNPDWKLQLNVNRIEGAPYAQNLSVVIAFPFDAFNTETLPAKPNLLMGFQTRLPGTPGTADYITGVDGGFAPATMQMVLTPHILGGTVHDFEWSIDTTGAANPVTFLSGEFDGDPGSNTILNALAWSAYVQNVPAHIEADLKVAENAIGSAAADSRFDLHWSSSAPSLVAFDYVEAESALAAASPLTADYATQLVADQMPTDEHFVLHHDETAGTLSLNHASNSPISEMTFFKRRSDGLNLTGVAADDSPAGLAVPTQVDLTLGLRGYASLDVDANLLDLNIQVTQVGGFNATSAFLGYDIEYVAMRVKNAPDLTADFDGTEKSFAIGATNPGESIPYAEMILDDDGRISPANAPLNLELPPAHALEPAWHLWSLIDDGTQGTVVARVLDVQNATFDHDAPAIQETVKFMAVARHPMQVYLRTGVDSGILPPPGGATDPDPYAEITAEIQDVMPGYNRVVLDFPLTIQVQSDQKIDEICVFGHIGYLQFGMLLGAVPTNSRVDFRPEGSMIVKALNDVNQTPGNDADDLPDAFSIVAAVVADANGLDPAVIPLPVDDVSMGFHSKNETFFPDDTPLKQAAIRLDYVPSVNATWHDEEDHTYIDIDTVLPGGPYGYLDGFQLAISTEAAAFADVTCEDVLAALPAATDASEHYAVLEDVAVRQQLRGGLFGVDSFHFRTDDDGPIPSTYEIDFELDPERPFTAASIDVDSNPASPGGPLGTFFGGDDVLGDLDISYVPPSLNVFSNLDPTFCTTGLFPIPGSDINQAFNVGGTDILVHASNLAPRFCVGFDVTGPTSTFTIDSTNLLGTQVVKTGLVEVLFQNTAAGLDGGLLFGADNAVEELRLRLDGVPSLAIAWTTAGAATTYTIDTTGADNLATPFIREDILDSMRFNASNTAGPLVVPTYPPPSVLDDHSFRLIDTDDERTFSGDLYGIDTFTVSTDSVTDQMQIIYAGDVNRDLTVQVVSNDGQFFEDYDVDAGLLIQSLPQQFDLTVTMDGSAVSYVADSGISLIRLGGPAVIGQPGASKGKFDNIEGPSDIRFNIDFNTLPARLALTLDPTSGATITAQTAALAASSIGSIIARVEDNGGFSGSSGLLGASVKDVRLRLDDIPSMSIGWSTGGGTQVDFSTVAGGGTFQYLGGAQVVVSTDQTTLPFATPAPGSQQSVRFQDDGGANLKRLTAGVFGIDEFHLASTNAPRNLTIDYVADEDRQLVVDVDATFGNHFFSSYDADITLTVDDLPRTWDLATDLATEFHYNGSSTISSVSILGNIDDTNDSNSNGTQVTFLALSLPSQVDLVIDPDASASLIMNAGIELVSLQLSSPNAIFGSDYRLVQVALNDIPARWSANWGGGQFLIESRDAADNPAPMGAISGLISTSDNTTTNNDRIAPFRENGPVQGGSILGGTAGGSRINYSEFTQEVDNRYFDSSGAPSVFSRLRDLYAGSEELDPGEDHAVAKIESGDLVIASFQFTNFQKVAYQPNANGGHYEFRAPTPGLHPLFAGVMLDTNAVTLQIENIPDSLTLDMDKAAGLIHFLTTDDVNPSAGQIDVYYGPLPMAADNNTAVRAVLNDTPSEVLINWGFGFPNGSAGFKASNPFELLFLAQNGSKRVVGGLELQELEVGYQIDILPLTVDFDSEIDLLLIEIPTSIDLRLLSATAGIDNSVDGSVGADYGKTGVNGFFNLYESRDVVDLVSPAFADPGGNQYVPQLTFMMKDFREFSINIALDVEILPSFLTPQIDGPNITLVGDFVLDFWSNANTDATFDVLGTDFGFRNSPDYTDNRPIHLIPFGSPQFGNPEGLVVTFEGFHGFGSHLDPFSAMTAAFAPAAVATIAAPLTTEAAEPILAAAIDRWKRSGIASESLDALSDVSVRIADLPGLQLARYAPGTIIIDVDAAGFGWYVDPTPADDSDFLPGAADALGRMDLMTVLGHELGHLLGFGHHDAPEVMAATLKPGTRLNTIDMVPIAPPSGPIAAEPAPIYLRGPSQVPQSAILGAATALTGAAGRVAESLRQRSPLNAKAQPLVLQRSSTSVPDAHYFWRDARRRRAAAPLAAPVTFVSGPAEAGQRKPVTAAISAPRILGSASTRFPGLFLRSRPRPNF